MGTVGDSPSEASSQRGRAATFRPWAVAVAVRPGQLHQFLCFLSHARRHSWHPYNKRSEEGASLGRPRQWAAGKSSHTAQMVLEVAARTVGKSEDQGFDNICPWRVCWEAERE